MSRPSLRRLGLLPVLAALLFALPAPPPRAAANLEVITLAGTAIGNRVWHDSLLPIPWSYHDPATIPAICNYISANAPPAALQPAHQAAFDAWQNIATSKVSFAYAGTTAVRNVGADGVNVVTFCDQGVLASNLGFVASTPSAALTVAQTVVEGAPCPPGQGLIAGLFCFPVGTYPAGTIIDADIRYNTFGSREASFSTNHTPPGSLDIQAVATHEQGHFIGLAHDPLSHTTMFPFVDDEPASDGLGQRVLRVSDIGSASRYYPEPGFVSQLGAIEGTITLNGVRADGVHVVAVDPVTMLGVAGRFSLSRFQDPGALGPEGPGFSAGGAGSYRIDGLPPGPYYVYVEYFDNSEFLTTRLLNRYNTTIGNSNVSNGNTGPAGQVGGWLGFIPALTEFYDLGESGHGGDGISPGTAEDNSDVASLVTVQAGQTTSGIDVAINIEPVNGQTPADRRNPTSRATLPNDALQGSDRVTAFLLNGGSDDFYAVRFPAALLPAPPYNVAEGLWGRAGRNLLPMVNRLVFTSPLNPALPALGDPVVASAGRVITGGAGGATSGGDIIDVRDQWNVTVNEPRDVWVVLNQPPSPPGTTLLTQGSFVLVARTLANQARIGRTLLTQNGGGSWGTLTADVLYDLVTEEDPPVMITSASPASREEGERADVVIHGTGFVDGATVDLGPGITVNAVTFVSPQELRCNVKIDDTGATSARDVNVTVANTGAVFPNVSRVFSVAPSTNRPPTAVALAGSPVECTSPAGAIVHLDGSGSTDEDSTPGTNDDIVSFEWFEDFGLPGQTLLSTDAATSVPLALGSHDLTLRVTDTHDAVSTAPVTVLVQDTTPPQLIVVLSPPALWPPNHALFEVQAGISAMDLCGQASVTLVSVTSDEPDDAAGGGDGHTTGDIQDAEAGTADPSFVLRAERQGSGDGRVYTAVYSAVDEAGNVSSASSAVTVPHSQNGLTDPLQIALRETAAGTLLEWPAVTGALHYNVIRGGIGNVQDAGSHFDLGPVRCLDAATPVNSTAGREDPERPQAGGAFFYLVEYNDGVARAYGTEAAGKPEVPGQGACAP
ncbi:MAG TPA: hypothetical protein VJV23_11225 [Candidatus Polarisedimenticolia bacterium]|nr:hypothetical protein [Candidatus Polarisedimenticolia bacterium]